MRLPTDVHPAAWALCVAMLVAVCGCFALAWAGKTVPDLLGLITTGLIASVGTMLAKTRRDPPPNGEPTEVTVTNTPEDPVLVEQA